MFFNIIFLFLNSIVYQLWYEYHSSRNHDVGGYDGS